MTRLTAERVAWIQIPESRLASVAFDSIDVLFADASSGDEIVLLISAPLAFAVVFRSEFGAIASFANFRVIPMLDWILIITRTALLAIGAHRVMRAVVANATRSIPRCQILKRIEMAPVGVIVALASLARVGHAANGRHPG